MDASFHFRWVFNRFRIYHCRNAFTRFRAQNFNLHTIAN
jgi:hypothetical protein